MTGKVPLRNKSISTNSRRTDSKCRGEGRWTSVLTQQVWDYKCARTKQRGEGWKAVKHTVKRIKGKAAYSPINHAKEEQTKHVKE